MEIGNEFDDGDDKKEFKSFLKILKNLERRKKL